MNMKIDRQLVNAVEAIYQIVELGLNNSQFNEFQEVKQKLNKHFLVWGNANNMDELAVYDSLYNFFSILEQWGYSVPSSTFDRRSA